MVYGLVAYLHNYYWCHFKMRIMRIMQKMQCLRCNHLQVKEHDTTSQNIVL